MLKHNLKSLFRLLQVAAWCALIATTLQAQSSRKPFPQWTAKEAEDLLTNSPWAQTRAGVISDRRVEREDPAQMVETKDTAVTVRLHSALPVRQAAARLRQLRNNYEKKNDSGRSAIDAKNKPLLECSDCADYYVVAMTPGPGSRNTLPLEAKMSLALMKLNVQLKNEKGESREMVKFVNPRFNDELALFYFSRLNSKGEPLIGPGNRKLIVTFDSRLFGGAPTALTKFEFDVAKIIVDGQVIF
jgi:hypothetical protein